MKELIILGTSYRFPEIRDDRFESLQEGIREKRELLQDAAKERRFLGFIPLKPQPLDPEARIDLMEELVGCYDDLMTSLKEKIGACKETFGGIGDGVRSYFTIKADELAEKERQRAALVAEAQAAGQVELVMGLEDERERIRGLTFNLTRASVLIIRKLRHALTALETLVDDEAAQRRVLASLRSSVTLFRKTHQFKRELDRIEDDIAEMTSLALNFDTLLRDNLGPLSLLIEEVAKVDSRVAESLVEIEKLSALLEAKKDLSGIPGRFDDRIFDILVMGRAKRDAMEGIMAAMSDPSTDLGEIDFDVELADRDDLDFVALTENMGELVRLGLEDLRSYVGREKGEKVEVDLPITAMSELSVQGMEESQDSESSADAPGGNEPPVAEERAPKGPEPAEPHEIPASVRPTHAKPSESLAEQPAPRPVAAAAEEGIPVTERHAETQGVAQLPSSAAPVTIPVWVEAAAKASVSGRDETAFNSGSQSAADNGKARGNRGYYAKAISRADPTFILFLLDRSGSMQEPYSGGFTKAEFLARTVDRTLFELAVRCNKAEGTRDYFHIACLGYGNGKVGSAFTGTLAGSDWAPISHIASSPAGFLEGANGAKTPTWIEVQSEGDTPMRAAFERACHLVADWCDAHPNSYPPTIINVSDGQSTDGSPAEAAAILRQIHTADGECLLFNLNVSRDANREIVFPSNSAGLDENGRLLFDMSSPFPPHILERARLSRPGMTEASRFFAFGAGAELVTAFFDLGTRTTRLE
jgi:hypothetical protein